ncbi:MAG: hypothetical protein JRJ29_09040 [Deltaproteobacteria bacterium]|nr:hypothetical protein [Deltaproteobacteria bacterium]
MTPFLVKCLEKSDAAMPRMISVPETLIEKISKAARAFQELENELEDYLFASDQAFKEKMRRSRKAHVEGNVKPFSLLKSEQCID